MISGRTAFMRWQSWGPSTMRLRWLLPWAIRAYDRRPGSVSLVCQVYRPTPWPSGAMTFCAHDSSLPASMSQSMTINPSPISRKPVALSRNDPFSMPVIHCLGSFLGMTASSLSVSTLMARSSSVTRAHSASFAGWAGTHPMPAIARSSPNDNEAAMAWELFMRRPPAEASAPALLGPPRRAAAIDGGLALQQHPPVPAVRVHEVKGAVVALGVVEGDRLAVRRPGGVAGEPRQLG